MKTGKLLEELIDIAKTSKTDFAISMNMTPSGLSKILKGGRLPFFKGKESIQQTGCCLFCRDSVWPWLLFEIYSYLSGHI